MRSSAKSLAAGFVAASFAGAASAATITPTVFTDDATVNSNCTLREAIEAANTDAAVDDCPAGDPFPTVDVIPLAAGTYAKTLAALLDVAEDLEVDGAGQATTDLAGDGAHGLLNVDSGVTLSLADLSLRGGHAGSGAGVRVQAGHLVLTDVTVYDCVATGGGGAVDVTDGSAMLTRVVLHDDEGDLSGGAINALRSDVDLTDCEVRDNSAPSPTSSSNGIGGGIASTGGDPFATLGGNLESPGDTCGLTDASDQADVADPLLGPLADHGGFTFTHLPLPGSPAIDQALTANCLADDQRGNARPLDGDSVPPAECDVGSVEVVFGETDALFADGFESGDTSAWSATVP
jgi:CSLREA domain-containing protein